jgi:hypothetical protein
MYSKSIGMHYEIELLGRECMINHIRFQNFMIKEYRG